MSNRLGRGDFFFIPILPCHSSCCYLLSWTLFPYNVNHFSFVGTDSALARVHPFFPPMVKTPFNVRARRQRRKSEFGINLQSGFYNSPPEVSFTNTSRLVEHFPNTPPPFLRCGFSQPPSLFCVTYLRHNFPTEGRVLRLSARSPGVL